MHIIQGPTVAKNKSLKCRFDIYSRFIKRNVLKDGSMMVHTIFPITLAICCLSLYLVILKLHG